MQYYLDNDAKLKKFVPIIHDSVVYPVILDANRTVCSMPPIINGAHSAVGLTTGCTEHVATQIVQRRLDSLNDVVAWRCGFHLDAPLKLMHRCSHQEVSCHAY